jgi:hypothetical protein
MNCYKDILHSLDQRLAAAQQQLLSSSIQYMNQTAHVCNLELLDGNFIIGRMLCPFSISERLGPFLTIVNLNLPVRDRTIA